MKAAVAYCLSIGADPHEPVKGWFNGFCSTKPRWMWYVGARP